MSGPCAPPPPPRGPRPRPHSSCAVCSIKAGDPVTVILPNGVPIAGPLADLSTGGISLAIEDHLQFFPWTSVTCIDWEPVERAHLAKDP